MNNHLADLISKLNFAKTCRLKNITVRNVKICREMLTILYTLGLIKNFKVLNTKELSVTLKWLGGNSVFGKLILLGKSSKLHNIKVKHILKARKNNYEAMISIVSTSKGLILDTNSILLREGGKNLIKILVL